MYFFKSFPKPHSHILHWAPITKLTCLGSLKRCKDFSRHQQEPDATLQNDSCYREHRCAGCKPWSGWAIQVSTNAAPGGMYVLGVMHRAVQPLCPWREDSGVCVMAAQPCGCDPLSAGMEKIFHLPTLSEPMLPCLPFLLIFSQPRDALIINSRILWFVPKIPEIRADMRGWGGDGIWRLANLRTRLVAYLILLRRTEVAWMPSDLPSPEEEKRLHLFKQILFENNSFWNKFQYLTSHTGTEGQLLQDTELHRGLGNWDFIKHWSQPTFMYCQEGCPAPWCCPWPQHASHSFPFTSLLCPWPTLCQSKELNQHWALQVLCHKRFFAGAVPSTSMQQDQYIGLSGNTQPGDPGHPF